MSSSKPDVKRAQVTIRIDQKDGKAVTKQFNAKSFMTVVYVLGVAILWTGSAAVYFAAQTTTQSRRIEALEALLDNPSAAPDPTSPANTAGLKSAPFRQAPPTSSAPKMVEHRLETPATDLPTDGFTVENHRVRITDAAVNLDLTVRKTTDSPQVEGRLAGIVTLRNSRTGASFRASSRPGIIPLAPVKQDVASRGLYFRAKKRVEKQLSFTPPSDLEFDEVEAELLIVGNSGEERRIQIPRVKLDQPRTLRTSSSAQESSNAR